MNKEQLKYIRLTAIIFSCLVASLTLCNLFTVATHGVNFETPQTENVKIAYDPLNQDLLFLTNFKVKNHGAYGIDDIDINAKLFNDNNIELVDFSKNDLVVPRGSNKLVDLAVALDLDKISILEWISLIYKDTNFKLLVDIDAAYMFNLIDITVDEEILIPWTSPLKNILENQTIINSLFTIIENAINESFIEKPSEVSVIEDIIDNKHYKNTYFDRYSIEINFDHISNFTKKMSTSLEVFLPKIDSTLKLDFNIEINLFNNSLLPKIKEVNISICC